MPPCAPDRAAAALGREPAAVLRPDSEAELGQMLRDLPPGAGAMPWGGGTKQAYGGPPLATTVICTGGLRGIVEYDPAELVITVRAGTRLDELAAALAAQGQVLPFDPPWAAAGATAGGTVAAGAAGPRSFGYGGVRDSVLGVRLVRADGVAVRGGGRVVKNVAGYDLPRLAVGSLGCLGIITELTFKVWPAPEAAATLAARLPGLDAAAAWVAQVAASPLEAAALDVAGPAVAPAALGAGGTWALARFEGTAAGVARRLETARGWLPAGAEARALGEPAAAAAWRCLRDVEWVAPAAEGAGPWLLVKVGVPAAAWPATVAGLPPGTAWQAQAGGARIWALLRGRDPAGAVAALAEVRQAAAGAGGYAAVWGGPLELRRAADAPGLSPDAARVIARLKARLDPTDRLNPGRLLAGR